MSAKQHSSGSGAVPRRAQPGSPKSHAANSGRPQEAWKAAELGLPEAEDKAPSRGHVADAGDAAGGASSATDQEANPMDPPQPRPRDYGETIRTSVRHVPASGPGGGEAMAGGAAEQKDDGTGGETWNQTLGDNTNAGMIRFFGAIAIFILIFASLFWLIGD
ncbi:hypothetical protein I6F07_29200 [Ensifer sp. IC4062]|nr:hypothetical protein [Ensifer sp. IC4062]MCA1444199.1 hypothetical protein [Ensifer sp. IC4062]